MAAQFVTLGMFIIDEFEFMDSDGHPTGRVLAPQIGGGGTYAAVGARIWLPSNKIGMVIDRGYDFPATVEKQLLNYGHDMWMFRDQPHYKTTRALNSYRGEHRNFEYMTPRIRITPRDIMGTKLSNPTSLHFICSPSRASDIMSEVREVDGWFPITIYEPIPYRCVPDELPALKQVLSSISILSPNAEEALSLLSLPLPPTKESVEKSARMFLEFGVGVAGTGSVVIRSGDMGAYVKSRSRDGVWIDAFWADKDAEKVVDVTGAGNSFLGGLGAGLALTHGDVYEAVFYASVSASFIIEQEGLPRFSQSTDDGDTSTWNGDSPQRRLDELRKQHGK
ncbi:Ribokinase-like protein [Crucibulum laeve]|uniref:Ribokinase-like protein n=1 Tax=Crucibulum laeve TaxID=68775 RepID=A0A5C3MCH5_9AGAR|nr:Ribokinase-like protein [Crucibulum laeve]